MIKLPSVQKQKYNEHMMGVAGEIGSGHFGVRYLQTVIPINEIDRLTLVSELPDSERWHVRQLFQRDIDTDRVLMEIMPYFKHPNKIKFFNPLTIVLMPIKASGGVLEGVEEVQINDQTMLPPDVAGKVWEAEGYYKLGWPDLEYPFGTVEYNSNQVKLVAVDGQHRLSALKRLRREKMANASDVSFEKVRFNDWRIPIVLLIFPPAEPDHSTHRHHVLLENVRDIFITINTNAQRPNRCREILLDDYSATAMCCQELLEHCHQKDDEVPLLFFDWRAHDPSEVNFYPENPQAFLRVEELEDYHIHYLMGKGERGEVLSQEQRDALFMETLDYELNLQDERAVRKEIRRRYHETLLPGVIYIFQHLRPFAEYVKFLTSIKASADTDIKKHAMSELLYGVHHGAENLTQAIQMEVGKLKEDCESEKKKLPSMFQNIIGGRGIFCGFVMGKNSRDEVNETTSSWSDAAKWYTEQMNTAYNKGYFEFDHKLLRHIAVDHNGHVVNYRLDQQWDALGAYCALMACALAKDTSKFGEELNNHLTTIEDTVYRGFKKELRPLLKDANPGIERTELNKEVEKRAKEKTVAQIKSLKKELKIENS